VEGSVPQPVAGRAAGREVAVVTVARVPEVARMEVGQAMATMVEEAEMAAAKVEEEEPAKTRGAVAEMVATMARVAMAKARVVAVTALTCSSKLPSIRTWPNRRHTTTTATRPTSMRPTVCSVPIESMRRTH